MAHAITLSLPEVELGSSDVELTIRADGELLGRAHISKGGIDWYPRNAKKPIVVSWTQFAEMMTAKRDE